MGIDYATLTWMGFFRLSALLLVVVATLVAADLLLADEGGSGRPLQEQKLDGAKNPPSFFADDETTAVFQLTDAQSPDQPCPEKELLHANANQQAIAQLLKDERNKNIKPGLTPPDDKDSPGIKIRFDAIRFLQDPNDPGRVRIRLVGPINEVECKTPLAIDTLLKSNEPVPVRFRSVTNHTGVTVTITTDLKLKLQNGALSVSDTKGTIDFAVGTFSPARLLYSSETDSVALPDLAGKRLANGLLRPRSLLEPEKL